MQQLAAPSCEGYSANKSVFSFQRTLQTWHCPHSLPRAALRRRCCGARRPCSSRSTFPTRRAHGSKPAARCYSGRMEQPDGLVGGRTPYRFIDPVSHTMRAAPTIVGSWRSAVEINGAGCKRMHAVNPHSGMVIGFSTPGAVAVKCAPT